jgi:hypothetical protein
LSWYELKDPVATAFGLSHDAAHVFLAGLVFAFLYLLLKPGRMAAPVAWLIVLALEVLNEVGDAIDWIGWTGAVNWHETGKDLLLTMPLPTAGLLVSRMLSRTSKPTRSVRE